MTDEDEADFKGADKCHICDKQYTEKDIRVRHYCYIIKKYRGSAHQECNSQLIFHNLCGYDGDCRKCTVIKLHDNRAW